MKHQILKCKESHFLIFRLTLHLCRSLVPINDLQNIPCCRGLVVTPGTIGGGRQTNTWLSVMLGVLFSVTDYCNSHLVSQDQHQNNIYIVSSHSLI